MEIALTKKQTIFWDAIFDENGIIRDNGLKEFVSFGAFGSAKSYIIMLCTLMICLGYPKTQWLYARATYPQLEDSVIRQFLEAFPGKDFQYEYKIQKREIRFSNGSIIMFRAFDVDTKILSNQYHGASICQAEEIPFDFYVQLWGRLRLLSNGMPRNIMLLEGNPAECWCKKKYKQKEIPKDTFFMESTSYDNPYLPKDYIAKLIQEMPEFWVRRYVYGEWSNFDEMVFSEFNESIHIIDPIPILKPWKRVNGFDYGWRNPSAISFLALDYEGNIHVYDEFKKAEQTTDLLIEAANRHGKFMNVIDPSTKTPDSHGKDIFSEISKQVNLIEARKSKLRNITNVQLRLKQRKIFIHRNCVEHIEEFREYKWKKIKLGDEKNHPEEVMKKNDHLMDAMMYGVQYIEDLISTHPDEKNKKFTLKHLVQAAPNYKQRLETLG